MSETQADVQEPGHSTATEKQIPQNTEPAPPIQHERDHVPQASDKADPSLTSDKDADADDLYSHKLGIAVADPAQDENIGAE